MHTKEGWFGTGNYIPRDPVHVWVRDSEPAAFPQIPEPPKRCIDLDDSNRFGPYCMPRIYAGRKRGMSDSLLHLFTTDPLMLRHR